MCVHSFERQETGNSKTITVFLSQPTASLGFSFLLLLLSQVSVTSKVVHFIGRLTSATGKSSPTPRSSFDVHPKPEELNLHERGCKSSKCCMRNGIALCEITRYVGITCIFCVKLNARLLCRSSKCCDLTDSLTNTIMPLKKKKQCFLL